MSDLTQPQAGGVTYQLATLTPQLSDSIIKDDSPQILQDEIWQFLGTDLSSANLTDIDMLNVLDFVNIAFANMLNAIPEDQWDKFVIQEIQWVEVQDDKGNKYREKRVLKEFVVNELWDAMHAKVYIKCCKSRGGFIMRQLTESKSQVSQDIRSTSSDGSAQPKKSGWKFW
jgi:hypothetical protein